MLEVRNVIQSFRSGFWLKPATILHDVSLDVAEGSITGFLGPNGAGKTTLIHLVTGIRRPKAGVVRWKGIETRERAARARIGYLPERPYFHEHLTGREVLSYFGSLSGLSRRTISERTPRLLERVGLTPAADRTLATYSKGMLQRIGIAQALIHEPEFLILDEPMSGLDPIGRAEMRQIIQELGREGRTVFFSSHIIPDLESICDRMVVIRQGKILRSGPLSELLSQPTASVELRFQTDAGPLGALEWARGASLEADGTRRIEVLQSELNVRLSELIAAGARILSAQPRHASLEEWFQKHF